jgi:hypothetical protein
MRHHKKIVFIVAIVVAVTVSVIGAFIMTSRVDAPIVPVTTSQ